MAGDAPKLDQVKLAKIQQSVRIGEFHDVLGSSGEKRLKLGSVKTNWKIFCGTIIG